MVRFELLNFALDPCLLWVFDKNVRAQQDIAMQFGFAGAIAANGVNMHTLANHVVGQDRRVLLVGGAGRDDLSALHAFFAGRTGHHSQPLPRQITRAFLGGRWVDIIKTHRVDAANRLEGQALEL